MVLFLLMNHSFLQHITIGKLCNVSSGGWLFIETHNNNNMCCVETYNNNNNNYISHTLYDTPHPPLVWSQPILVWTHSPLFSVYNSFPPPPLNVTFVCTPTPIYYSSPPLTCFPPITQSPSTEYMSVRDFWFCT